MTDSPSQIKDHTNLSAELPLTELLNSQFCVGTALTKVNRQAVEHTKVLGRAATKISRFWRMHHTCHDMFYDGRPATWAGPLESEIGSGACASDVMIVRIALSYRDSDLSRKIAQANSADRQERKVGEVLEHITRKIASHITQWYQDSLTRRHFCTNVMSPDAAYLHSRDRFFRRYSNDDAGEKCLVKVTPATNFAPCRMMVRAGILRDYLQHHSIWAALYAEKDCPVAKSLYLSAWMATTLNILTYGNQLGSVDLRIHRSAAAYLSYAFPDSSGIQWDQVDADLKNFLFKDLVADA